LGAIHSSREKYTHDDFINAGATLFGGDFQSTISGKVEKESALVIASSLARKASNVGPTVGPSSRRRDKRKSN